MDEADRGFLFREDKYFGSAQSPRKLWCRRYLLSPLRLRSGQALGTRLYCPPRIVGNRCRFRDNSRPAPRYIPTA